MKVLVAVTLLACGITYVCGQLVTNTSGVAGELCGPHHHCLTNSTCIRAKGNYHCACPDPLEGNAKVGCVKKGTGSVFIQSDPHIKNLYNQFVSVSTPCRYRVMEYIFDSQYWTRVYADNLLYKGGKFYTNRIEVRTAKSHVPANETDMKILNWHVVLIEGSTTSEGQYQFKEWRKSVNSTQWVTPNEETRFMSDGSEVLTEYDSINNLAMIRIDAVGLRMWFRPADSFALEHGKRLPQVPGAVITVDSSPLSLASVMFSEIDLSSTPTGPDLKTNAAALQMSLDMYAIFLTLNNLRMEEIDSFCPQCDATNRLFRNVCYGPVLAERSVRVCSVLYTDQQLLSCIAANDMRESYLPHIFRDCMNGICSNNKAVCQYVKSHIKEIGCDLPESLKKFDCSTLGGEPAAVDDHGDVLMEANEEGYSHTIEDMVDSVV